MNQATALEAAASLLREHTGLSVRIESPPVARDDSADGVLVLVGAEGEERFVAEVAVRGWIEHVNRAARAAVAAARHLGGDPLVVAPYVAPSVSEAIEAEGAHWLDLSGNASIRTGRRTIVISGRENAFPDASRRRSLGAAGERVARLLLIEPNRTWRQLELAERAGVAQSSVSRALSRLASEGLVDNAHGAIRLRNGASLLDVLAASEGREQERVVRGVVAARTGPEAAALAASRLDESKAFEYGLTGLAGAWLYDRFADYTRATILLYDEVPILNADELRNAIGARAVERGANIELRVSTDPTVLAGVRRIDGLAVAHPVQVYLDLQRESGRATEAAAELRRNHLAYAMR